MVAYAIANNAWSRAQWRKEHLLPNAFDNTA